MSSSSRRTRSSTSRHSSSSGGGGSSSRRITDDQINDLVSKLQQLLPHLPRDSRSARSDKVSSARVLQETCNYIRSLHREVDDLSEQLSDLLANTDTNQAAIIRSLLMQ